MARTPRENTNRLLDMMDEGILSPRDIVIAAVNYMSDDEVGEMMDMNEWSERFDEDEDEDEE